MEASNHFDEQLKRALEDLESSYDPGSWDMLEQRMEADYLAETDDLVRNRLSELEATTNPGSWDTLEQLIEAEETAEILEKEAYIDNLAYEKLNNLRVPYQSHHWRLMARRLEEEFSLRHKLYKYKVAEVSLMVLLLLTIIRFLPYADQLLYPEITIEKETDWHPAAPELILPDAPGQQHLSPQEVVPDGTEPDGSGIPIADVAVPDEPAPTQPVTQQYGGKSLLSDNTPADQEGQDLAAESLHFIAVDPLTSQPLEKINSTDEKPQLFEKIVERNIKRSRLKTPGAKNAGASPDLITSVEATKVKSNYSWELPALKTAIFKKTNDLRFSIFTTTDLNFILTPKDDLFILDTVVHVAPDTSMALGYGGGILASLKRDKWEIQMGGIYSFKRYLPNTPIFLFKTLNYYIKEDFHGIQLDILQVPLNVQYHFKDHGNWRFYANAGMSAHFVTSSIYEIEYQATPAFSALPPPPVNAEISKSIRQEKEFPEGLADGGQLRDNFFMTANVGFGLERLISTKWTLFFQPNYQHYLMSEGIGTNRDKIYTMSFYLGTKFSID